VDWPNPSAWDDIWGNYIRNTKSLYGTYTDVIDMNGDGYPDRVVYDRWTSEYKTWKVYFNYGSGFGSGVDWPNPSAWHATKGNLIRNDYVSGGYNYGTSTDVIDMDGDGLPDRVVYDKTSPYYTWSVYFNKGPVSDLLSKVENGIGGTTEITYLPSTAYEDLSGNKVNQIPFVVQTVRSYTQKDGRGNSYLYKYFYSDASYDPVEVEFRGFGKVTAYQMTNATEYESMTETEFHQDYYLKGKVLKQTLTSAGGHTRQVDNVWVVQDNGNGTKFPRLDQTTSTIKDMGEGGPFTYSHSSTNTYDQYFNVTEEHKWHLEGSQWIEDIRTYFNYTNFTDKWILSKPTEIKVTDGAGSIVSRKWMDYDSNSGNILTEEVCKNNTPNTGCASRNSVQNPVITYQYYTNGNLWKITDPRNNTTTINYDSTKTHVYETINCLGHKTTTEYDLGTGNLKKLTPPHLQLTSYSFDYSYDVFGRKSREDRPDGGWTEYTYPSFTDPNNQWGDPYTQHVQKREHIVGGPSILDYYTNSYFDGMGRNYWTSSSGPDGKSIITETLFDTLGRVWKKYNPRFNTDSPPYPYTELTYDGLSRVIDVLTPDNYHIGTIYQGLRKIVTNQRGYSTAYTYDVYQRLVKVEEPTTPTTTFTEYSYDTLGNLTQVRAAKDASGNDLLGAPIITTMTYDSLSKKRTMTDPDMGYWTYEYDKSGNLVKQTDPKNPTQGIIFNYDCLNRLTEKVYPTHPVTFFYDDPTVPYSKGKLTKVSDHSGGELKEDRVLEYDEMQRVKRSQKTIPGSSPVTFEKSYDSVGRVVSITYPGSKIYSYKYDVAGNLLYVKDSATLNNLVEYSDFTALGQHKIANFPKPNNVSVKTTYTYDSPTARLMTLLTQRLVNGQLIDPVNDTYQALNYQYDEKGNILTLVDSKNGITHSHIYDPLDRLTLAKGNNGSAYNQSYAYDRIGNIIYKSDVGTYSYSYSNKPHAVQSAGPFTFTYDANGNMTSKTGSGVAITINPQDWNYDNKPTRIQNGSTVINLIYDGNGQRVKKISPSQTVFYFGELYEIRNGVNVIHVFAGNKRVASIRSDGREQYYHSNHLGSASVITDQYGVWKERIEYFPFGSYREDVKNPLDPTFPDANYTFTDQEDDDELGFYNYGARFYDPLLGRFISPDRLVPDPGDPQALNRYTYCLNNPLIYTDPSGEFIWLAISIIVGSFMGAYQADKAGENPWKGAMLGAIIGATSYMVGNVVGGLAGSWATSALTWVIDTASPAYGAAVSVTGAVAGGFAGGATGGALNAAAYGGSVWQAALYGGLIGAAIAGTVQGAIELNNWVNSAGVGGPGASKNSLIEVDPNGVEYVNPTGGEIRGCDPQGCGHWGAKRAGGEFHKGIDVISTPGQEVVAPFEGRATPDKFYGKEGVAIAGKQHYARNLYVKPNEAIIQAGAKGLTVKAGDVIGTALDITTKYPGIINHVHLELYRYTPWGPINPTPFIFRGR